jgi:curved DNA-binding protein
VTLWEVATGAQKTVAFQHQGRSENINVKIPKGILDGKKLRVAGKGEPSPYGGPAGDLFIKVKIVEDSRFRNEGHDLIAHQTITLTQSLLGAQISVPTIEGGTLSLKVPPGTRHKTRMRLPGHGLPHMKGGKRGNLFVVVLVDIPKNLTEEQHKLISQLAATGL